MHRPVKKMFPTFKRRKKRPKQFFFFKIRRQKHLHKTLFSRDSLDLDVTSDRYQKNVKTKSEKVTCKHFVHPKKKKKDVTIFKLKSYGCTNRENHTESSVKF